MSQTNRQRKLRAKMMIEKAFLISCDSQDSDPVLLQMHVLKRHQQSLQHLLEGAFPTSMVTCSLKSNWYMPCIYQSIVFRFEHYVPTSKVIFKLAVFETAYLDCLLILILSCAIFSR